MTVETRHDRELVAPARTTEVWAGCAHTLTRAEEVLVASAPFQRLRRLRQMGLAFHAWPNAENTRASHSFGVAYWAARYLDALRRRPDAATRAGLAAAEPELDGLSLDVVLRLFGLLHDIDLLPLGHTLRYQSGLFPEAPGRPRLWGCVDAVTSPMPAFGAHLAAAAGILADDGAALPAELVNSGLGADLVDFALRDSFAIARPQVFPAGLEEGLRLVETDGGWGLALDVTDPRTAPARVALADDLYRARFEVFAASVYHPVKLAADAMVDLALRRLGPDACRALLPESLLMTIGDDELLDRLAGEPIVAALRAGSLHEEAWRTADLAAFRRRPGAERALALDPAWRGEAETALAAHLRCAGEGDVIVAVSAPTMQAKPADARFAGAGNLVFPLAGAPAPSFEVAAADTAGRYEGLWSLRVYVSARQRAHAGEVAAAAEALFGAP
ncbi:MAG: hypothetical protein ACR2HM_05785 [Acidimicrobiales bacterium]